MGTSRMIQKLMLSRDSRTVDEMQRLITGHKEAKESSKEELVKFVLRGDLKEALMIANQEDFIALMRQSKTV